MGRLEGKIALITGISRGQGRAAAIAFAREGAKIVGCDFREEGARETAEAVRVAGGEMEIMAPIDVASPEGATQWVSWAVGCFGGVDILYNNASDARVGPFADMPVADWYYTIRNELDIVFLVTQAVWPHLVRRGGGSIIHTASIAAIRGQKLFGQSAHCAAKGGVLALSTALALEGGPHRIRSNAILPGVIRHPAFAQLDGEPARMFRALIDKVPLGRMGEPKDIADLAVYLASDESSWVTGAQIVIDGGLVSWD